MFDLIFLLNVFFIVIILMGNIILYKYISYPDDDRSGLLFYANSLRKGICFEKNYVIVWTKDTRIEDFGYKKGYFSYNLFLNLIKLFPPKYRFRGAQLMNFAIYFFFLVSLLWFHLSITASLGMTFNSRILLSLMVVVAIGANAKIMTMVMMLCVEIMSIFFLSIALIIFWYLYLNPSYFLVLSLGVILGLAFRNKQSEICFVLAGALYLFFLKFSFSMHILYFFGVCLVNIDLLYLLLCKKENSAEYITSIWAVYVPLSLCKSLNEGIICAVKLIFSSLRTMVNLYSTQSLWPTIGSALVLFPIVILYLLKHDFLVEIWLYPLLVIIVYVSFTIFIRREKKGECYFGARQMNIISPLFILFVGFMLIDSYNKQRYNICWGLFCWFIFYGVHQLYMVLFFYFSNNYIGLKSVATVKKDPEKFTIVLSNFIKHLKGPFVVLGSKPSWGEVYNFFEWSIDKRCVNVDRVVNDEQILELIDRYKVTHIIISPYSWFLDKKSSLRCDVLSDILIKKLCPIYLQKDLTVFEVIN